MKWRINGHYFMIEDILGPSEMIYEQLPCFNNKEKVMLFIPVFGGA